MGLAVAQAPHTIAERTNYEATSTNAEVLDYCKDLARQSPRVRVVDLGTTHEARKISLVIVADPPIGNPEEAARSGKLVLLAMGNIHAGCRRETLFLLICSSFEKRLPLGSPLYEGQSVCEVTTR